MFDRNAYQLALDAQSACNLSGLSKSLSNITTYLWAECDALKGPGTEYVNTHPIVKLFLHQMAYLAGANVDLLGDEWATCYDICKLRTTDFEGQTPSSPEPEAQTLLNHTTALLLQLMGQAGRECQFGGELITGHLCEVCSDAERRAVAFLTAEVPSYA